MIKTANWKFASFKVQMEIHDWEMVPDSDEAGVCKPALMMEYVHKKSHKYLLFIETRTPSPTEVMKKVTSLTQPTAKFFLVLFLKNLKSKCKYRSHFRSRSFLKTFLSIISYDCWMLFCINVVLHQLYSNVLLTLWKNNKPLMKVHKCN